MILVFCEFGGKKLLGKARELADLTASRVLALAGEKETDTQNLISLGADEVFTCFADGISEWVDLISDLVRKTSGLRIAIFPSNRICDSIMAGVYFECSDKVGAYLDGADRIVEGDISKSFPELGLRATSQLVENKVNLASVKLSSIPEPFEEGTRYGKVSALPSRTSNRDELRLSTIGDCRGVSSILTILLGSKDQRLQELSERIAEKYMTRVKYVSGKTQVVYGPCLAIEVRSRVGDLPEFKGPLLSVNSTKAPVTALSDLAGVSEDVEAVLEGLL